LVLIRSDFFQTCWHAIGQFALRILPRWLRRHRGVSIATNEIHNPQTSMETSILFPQLLIPLDSVGLARLVTNIGHPEQNYYDPPFESAPAPHIYSRKQASQNLKQDAEHGFAAALTSLLSIGYSRQKGTRVSIVTPEVRTYTLHNVSHWFTDGLKYDSTKEWIEKAIDDGEDVYMIIGYHTVQDAQISQEATKNQTTSLKASVSPAVSTAISLGNSADLTAGPSHSNSYAVDMGFVSQGEQVCAIQYRKVRFRWFSSRKADTSSLGKNPYWKVQDTWRGTSEPADDVKDSLELELDQIDTEEDEWVDQEIIGDDVLLVLPNSPPEL
jgi:hypothetical protein